MSPRSYVSCSLGFFGLRSTVVCIIADRTCGLFTSLYMILFSVFAVACFSPVLWLSSVFPLCLTTTAHAQVHWYISLAARTPYVERTVLSPSLDTHPTHIYTSRPHPLMETTFNSVGIYRSQRCRCLPVLLSLCTYSTVQLYTPCLFLVRSMHLRATC